jgi:GNAT superfamily N-acetyltransferase
VLDLWEALMGEGRAADPRYVPASDARSVMREQARDGWVRVREPFPAAFVAVRDETCIAYVAIKALFPLPVLTMPPTALFTDLYVGPAHRRSGVGLSLVEHAAKTAASAGYDRFEVGTLALDARAVAFWRSVGFVDWKVTFLRDAAPRG